MSDYIEREKVIALIEEKQKELCPVGMFIRQPLYGSDLEKFDAWEEIIAEIERIPSEDVAPVAHGQWEWHGPCYDDMGKFWATCSICKTRQRIGDYKRYCPKCSAKMDKEEANEEADN